VPTYFLKFSGEIDRRSPQNEGTPDSPVLRENWLSRDGRCQKPQGTEKAITTTLDDIPRWLGRYYTIETGQISPKTFTYTKDGQLWVIDDLAQTATSIKKNLNTNGYSRHTLFKTSNQTNLFLVDGVSLYKYDGNNDNKFDKVNLLDSNGDSVKPIDVIEHLDRLWVISNTDLFVSKNLEPEIFDDASDSLQIIVGSGRGKNKRLAKIGDKLYIVNTEGIFAVSGDVISALAATFEVRLVDERKIIAGGSLAKTEKAIIFVAEDYEIWSFDGVQSQLLSYKFKLKDSISPTRELLDKAVATYYNNYYMLSFVEKGEVEPNIEIWWDSLEGKINVVRGRNVSCYLEIDPAEENDYLQTGRSDTGSIMNADRGYNFDGVAIVSKIRTRDITPAKGELVRFLAFYPEIQPTGNRNISMTYLLDGRSSNPSGADANWSQNLRGETITLGSISIGNQAQFTSRVRPKISYSKGESIAFYIEDSTLDLRADLMGIGIEFVSKGKSKGKTIGQ
jgi:hypothetical protein